VLAIVIVSTVGAYVYSTKQPARYRSSTQFIVSTSSIDAIVSGVPAGTDYSSVFDQAKLLLSAAVADRVRARNIPGLADSQVTAAPVESSSFVVVTAESNSPGAAAAVANAYVREYFALRTAQVTRSATDAISKLRAQLADIPRGLSTDQTRLSIEQTIRQLEAAQTATPLQARQTNPAGPGVQFAPTPKRDAVFALTISLALGLALAFALERLDRRIRSVDEIPEEYGAPLLSVIPHSSKPIRNHDGIAEVPDALREPFRSLRTNIQLAALDRPVKCIVVASAVSGEGKSTVVRNLALTYREWGQSVVVLEADLRRPTLSKAFGLQSTSPGLTAVLTGACSLKDALHEVEVDIASMAFLDKVRVGENDLRAAGTTTRATASKLMLLPSGAPPPNPQAVIASDRARRVIEYLGQHYDVVLIDTPPLLAVSDAMALLPQADGVVLVARIGVTHRAEAQRAGTTARLDPSVRLLGVVANDLDYVPGGGYGYGYGYGSSSNGKTA
jgi:succinoglycan biosynthesis transport protein ExoP